MMSQVTTFFSLYRRSRTLAWCTHVHTHTHTPKWRSRDVTKLCGNIFLSPCSFAPVDWERGREEENLRGGEGIEGNLIFLLVDTIVEKYFSFQRKTNKKAWKFKEESFISIYFEYLYYGTFFFSVLLHPDTNKGKLLHSYKRDLVESLTRISVISQYLKKLHQVSKNLKLFFKHKFAS